MQISVYRNNMPVETFESTPGTLQSFKIVPVSGSNTVIKLAIPLIDIHSFWHCNCNEFHVQLVWRLNFTCALNHNMPYLAFFNLARQLRCAVATDNLTDDTNFSGAMNQQECTFDITLDCSAAKPFNLIIDRREDISFTESVAQWRKSVMPENLYFPSAAWEPVFCTWYAVHGEVTSKWIERQALKARALGFGTLIVDDGWCYDEAKRVNPQTIVNWYNTIGDWNISETKFPDFKEHVKKIQSTGLKYLLWVAPHLIGTDSKFYAEHPDWTLPDTPHEGYRRLDVAKHPAVDHLAEKFVSLAVDNGLDGLKIDFLNIVRPDAASPIGNNNKLLLEKVCNKLREKNPDALIEFRQAYATIGMLPYATQFRVGDVPFDWALNFRRMVDIRISLGDGIPIHADPAYWGPEEYPENVARHMMIMLLGVPMLSMDLNTLPAEHLSIVQYYLALYKEKQQLLNFGHWNILFSSGNAGVAMAEDENEVLAIIMDDTLLDKVIKAAGNRKLTLLNISAETLHFDGKTAAPGETIC